MLKKPQKRPKTAKRDNNGKLTDESQEKLKILITLGTINFNTIKRYGYYNKDIETTIAQITDDALKTQKSKDWEQYLNKLNDNNNNFKQKKQAQRDKKGELLFASQKVLTALITKKIRILAQWKGMAIITKTLKQQLNKLLITH